jgi:SAM-dependent methyltransferase
MGHSDTDSERAASASEKRGPLRHRAVERVRAQFGRPTGLPGRIAGMIMAHRASNRRRNAWAVSLLDVQRDDRVLEVGVGPGIAIKELSARAREGYVCGLDHSAAMVRQAARRNAEGVRRGQVDLRLGCAESLPAFEAPFDKVLAVNVTLFWDRPVELLGNLRRVLRMGGRIAIAFQPRGPGATDEAAATTGHELVAVLRDAGFSQVRLETLELKPAAVCVLGVNAPGEPSGGLDSTHGALPRREPSMPRR